MGLYNFKKQFVPFILSGEKRHTIRATRTNPDKPGNTLYLYTGLRTKNTKLIKVAECVKIENIDIFKTRDKAGDTIYKVWIDENELSPSECEQLARRDGFSCFHEMMKFWTEPKNRLPFAGQVVHWK